MNDSIDSYSFGKIVIDGKKYTNDLIILPNRIKDNWWRKKGHKLLVDDISDDLDSNIDTLIIGTGAYGRMKVPKNTRTYIKSKDIKLIVKKSENACKAYNKIHDSGNVALAIHLTC
ncbi:MAG: hypothetical protein GF329_19675 [Candidatus Lokiarchaeota archaeon]|nr:hypothetical protein [Candidatus Lokiarchaeota archaeon]